MNSSYKIRIHPDAQRILNLEGQDLVEFLACCLEEHGRNLCGARHKVLKDAPESSVSIVEVPGRPKVCVKAFRWRGWLHAFKGLMRRSGGLRTFANGRRLHDEGVGTARPLALIRSTRIGVVRSEWIVMEVIPDALELDRYLLSRMQAQWSVDEKRSLTRTFGRFIGSLHAGGTVHSDLKTCNILVSETTRPVEGAPRKSRDTRVSFALVDYDDVKFGKAPTERAKIKNLVQIFLSTPVAIRAQDRLRFLREYALHAGISQNRRRALAREVLDAAGDRDILYVGFTGDVTEKWR